MPEKQSILKFMIIEHGILYNLIASVRFQSSSVQNDEAAIRNFEKFKAKLIPHHIAEESIVFKLDKKTSFSKLTKTLLEQHKAIIVLVKKIDFSLANHKDVFEDGARLQTILRSHLDLEEKKFYPILDEQLTDEQKEELIKKVLAVSEQKNGFFDKIKHLF